MSTLTRRQENVLYFYYHLGWSFRLIGRAFSIDQRTVRREHETALNWLRLSADECRTPPIIGGLLRSSSSSQTGDATTALHRQEKLLSSLESWMDRRAADRGVIEECMGSHVSPPTHIKKNSWDAWELDYLARSGKRSMCTSDYDAKRLDRYVPHQG